MEKIKIQKLHPNAKVPTRMSEGAAGYDAMAALDAPIEIAVGERVLIPLGIALEIPKGFEVQVRPRSGLALKKGVTVLNSPGTIDSDYRGELKAILINLGNSPVLIEPGERVCQLVAARVERLAFEESETLSASERGSGGFGST